MFDPSNYRKAELDFIDQYTRVHMVAWADRFIREGQIDRAQYLDKNRVWETDLMSPYIEYANYKGWVTKAQDRLTSKGMGVVVSRLKKGG